MRQIFAAVWHYEFQSDVILSDTLHRIWVGIIFAVRVANIIIGLVRFKWIIALHTVLNKITGLLLFLFPFIIPLVETVYPAAVICIVASLASLHEGYVIINTDK